VIDGFLNTEGLKELTGYERAGDIERCLREQGIHTFWGKDGPWTTRELINAAAGLKPGNEPTYGDIL
jgi:hypothetical protein